MSNRKWKLSEIKRIVFKKIVAGDIRKYQNRSNDAPSGGGARDLRFNPATAFLPIFRLMFPGDRVIKGGRSAFIGELYWNTENGIRTKEAFIAMPTSARPFEVRLTQISKCFPKDSFPRVIRDCILLLVQDSNDRIWPVFVDEDTLKTNWPKRISAFIIQGMHEKHDSTLAGFIDFSSGQYFSNVRRIGKIKKLSAQRKKSEQICDAELAVAVATEDSGGTVARPYVGHPQKRGIPIRVLQQSVYPRSKKVATNALCIAEFKCEVCASHPTFLRKKDGQRYMESHHLIPMGYSGSFENSLDIEENVICLCSNCHNQLHYGREIEPMLSALFEKRRILLEKAGIYISFEELLNMYC